MFCPNCGANNPDNAANCFNCGISLNTQPQTASAPAEPQTAAPAGFKNYLTINIVLLVFSLLCGGGCIGAILSTVGIVMAAQAKSAFEAGDLVTAESKAKVAKIMMIVAMIICIIGCIVSAILLLVYGGSIVALIASEMMVAARVLGLLAL